jgi:hypothetical protein
MDNQNGIKLTDINHFQFFDDIRTVYRRLNTNCNKTRAFIAIIEIGDRIGIFDVQPDLISDGSNSDVMARLLDSYVDWPVWKIDVDRRAV